MEDYKVIFIIIMALEVCRDFFLFLQVCLLSAAPSQISFGCAVDSAYYHNDMCKIQKVIVTLTQTSLTT
jgi:hypothetical protein